jgi:hypothetical protein
MKLIYITLILSFLIPLSAFSQGKSEPVQKAKDEKETQKRRRKKVMMCHDCGKPETECDCEGEGHGVVNEESEPDKKPKH